MTIPDTPIGDDRPWWRFRPDIEGMRAVAIVGVILFHAGIRQVSGGFLGVDVFFVISGFLITGILVGEAKKTGSINLGNFWARRVRRLLPAAALVSLCTLLLSAQLDSPFTQQAHAKSAISFATYWSNLLFVRRGADYFDQGLSSDPFLHTWTLAVEEQYYLLFAPLVLLIATVAVRYRGDLRRWLFGLLVIGSVVSFLACLYLTNATPLISFYTLPPRAWEFGVGGTLAVAAASGFIRAERSLWNSALAFAGLTTIIAVFLMVDERAPHPGVITLLPVLGTAVLIRAGTSRGAVASRVLESGIARFLGRLSYSWYLWHWPITVYWERLPFLSGAPMVVGMPIVSLLLAWGTYVAIEIPGQVAGWLQGARRGLLAAVAIALITTTAAATLIRLGDRRLKDPALAFVLRDRNTKVRIYGDGCHVSLAEVNPKECAYGNARSSTSVVLFGDSHAAQWFEALAQVSSRLGWRLVVMTKSGCPSISSTIWLRHPDRIYTECERWRDLALARIHELNPTVVAIANSNWHNVADASAMTGSRVEALTPVTWRHGLMQTLNRLPRSASVLLLEDSPNPFFDVPDCLSRNIGDPARCDFRRDKAIAAGFPEAARSIGQADPRVTYADFTDHICDDTMCRASRGDTAIYSDADHLAVRFSVSLAPALESVLREMSEGRGRAERAPNGSGRPE